MGSDTEQMNVRTKFGYGTGHVFNDMCGCMWFTYLLLFYHSVVRLNNTNTGLLFIIGQITNGLATILVGILSDLDKDCWIYLHYGKRKVI